MSTRKEEILRRPVPCDITAKVLHNLLPAHSLVHVGLLRNGSPMDGWLEWKVPHALHIDAPRTESLRSNVEATCTQPAGGLLRLAVWLASTTEKRTLHTAGGVFAGDGLLPAAAIAAIAPHTMVHELPGQAVITLDQLLIENEKTAPNWLVLNTLAAGEVLAGASETLRAVEVVWTRARLHALEGWPEETHVDWIASFLQPHRFVLAAMDEGINPALGVAIFVRNPSRLKNHEARGSAEEKAEAYIQPYAHIVDNREDGQVHLQSKVQALLLDNKNLQHRQQLLQEELIKAHAQIELIKDLLLRESGI